MQDSVAAGILHESEAFMDKALKIAACSLMGILAIASHS